MSTSAQIPDGFVEVPWTGPVVAFNDELNGRRIVGPGSNVILPIHQAHADKRVDFSLSKKQEAALQREHNKRAEAESEAPESTPEPTPDETNGGGA